MHSRDMINMIQILHPLPGGFHHDKKNEVKYVLLHYYYNDSHCEVSVSQTQSHIIKIKGIVHCSSFSVVLY